MSDSRPDSPKPGGAQNSGHHQPNQSPSPTSLEADLGNLRVEDLGEVRSDAIDGDGDDEKEHSQGGASGDGGARAGKQRKTSAARAAAAAGPRMRKKRSTGEAQRPRRPVKPTVVASAYESYHMAPPYIAPISRIPPIPDVAGVTGVGGPSVPAPTPRGNSGSNYDHGNHQQKQQFAPSASAWPNTHGWLPERMVGKRINEFGDVVDDGDDGAVLGRVAGDLPSMVGRAITNRRGDVLGDGGELLGYVAEIADQKKDDGHGGDGYGEDRPYPPGLPAEDDEIEVEEVDDEEVSSHGSPPKSIDQFIGKPSASLQVDHRGNILDSHGNIIGHFRDTSKDPKTNDEGGSAAGRSWGASDAMPGAGRPRDTAAPQPPPHAEGGGAKPGAADAAGDNNNNKPKNAADWRKENDSPSDIFLDVKSTKEGIQLTIRIPTIFAGNGHPPQVNFTS